MEVDQGRHNRLPADVLHIGVFGDGDGARFSRGHDMIAFNDQHGVLDCRPACSINQARAFKHDLSRLGLSAGPTITMPSKMAKITQVCERFMAFILHLPVNTRY
jgi:hypothetical protein